MNWDIFWPPVHRESASRNSLWVLDRKFRQKIGETEYVLSWIPLGGYVKLTGESGNEELSPDEEKRSFSKQNVWKRIMIVAAGPAFNFLLAVVIFIFVLMYGLPTLTAQIGEVQKESAADQAGMLHGDKILSLDGKKSPIGRKSGKLSLSPEQDRLKRSWKGRANKSVC